jgi:hypothetical protein
LSRNCFDLLVKIIVVLSYMIAFAYLKFFADDVIVIFGVNCGSSCIGSCVARHWRTMFDEVSDGPILRQGAWDTLRTSRTSPLSRSDLVPWHSTAQANVAGMSVAGQSRHAGVEEGFGL